MRTLSALLLTAALAAAADPKPSEPFNGKDLTGWKLKDEKKSQWKATVVGTDEKGTGFVEKELGRGTPLQLVNVKGGGCDVFTEQKYGDCTIEMEFMVPKASNSGIYVMGEYEVQVLDSFGKADDKLTEGDLGAIYSAAKPKKNLAKKPGEWQTFKIEFEAPKFDGDKKTKNAKFVKVTLNGEVLHENVEMKQQTPGGLTGKEMATGPLMFQGDHGPVAFRNIKVTPKK
jgi:hypothetical protein